MQTAALYWRFVLGEAPRVRVRVSPWTSSEMSGSCPLLFLPLMEVLAGVGGGKHGRVMHLTEDDNKLAAFDPLPAQEGWQFWSWMLQRSNSVWVLARCVTGCGHNVSPDYSPSENGDHCVLWFFQCTGKRSDCDCVCEREDFTFVHVEWGLSLQSFFSLSLPNSDVTHLFSKLKCNPVCWRNKKESDEGGVSCPDRLLMEMGRLGATGMLPRKPGKWGTMKTPSISRRNKWNSKVPFS